MTEEARYDERLTRVEAGLESLTSSVGQIADNLGKLESTVQSYIASEARTNWGLVVAVIAAILGGYWAISERQLAPLRVETRHQEQIVQWIIEGKFGDRWTGTMQQAWEDGEFSSLEARVRELEKAP